MRRTYRLRASEDFQRVRQKGRTLVHPLLVISVLSNGMPYSRFGFAVGRRLGEAVVRNRIKRRIRESVRVRVQKRLVAGGWDVVLIARVPMRVASFHQVDAAIGLMLHRAGLTSEVSEEA
jgi:ribonuclease P protein component